jgi:hypothetical protein
MKPLPAILVALALLVALTAVGYFLFSEEGPPTPVIEDELEGRDRPPSVVQPRVERVRGGVFAGIVVDRDDRPVAGATVLLIAVDTGEEALGRQPADPAVFDPAMLAVIGPRLAAETTTDVAGRFRVAADGDSAIHAVCAYRMGFSPEIVPVKGPDEGVRVVLPPAGRFVGYVIDGGTGRPVSYAQVAIYLQQIARPFEGEVGKRVEGRRSNEGLSPFAALQRWVAEVLGPRVWNLKWEGDETLRVWTDENGMFSLAPIMGKIQLEFVITHAGYAWTEHDKSVEGRVARTVVPDGETVERTFRLERGKEIAGRVIDESNRGVADVLVSVEHVSQYVQHWWYRVKPRRARTRRDGSFRVQGLSYGPYVITLQHPAFGRETVPAVPENSTDLQLSVESRGALHGTVKGLEERKRVTQATLILESSDTTPELARHVRKQVVVSADGTFDVRGLRPGSWSGWIQAGGMSSQPVPVEIEALGVTEVTFELGGGGAFSLYVWDAAGRLVDPATVMLIRLPDDETGQEQGLGRFVTREGRLDAEGIVPGRYALQVQAPGVLMGRSEPFVVTEDGRTDAGAVTLQRPGVVRIQGISYADGSAVTDPPRLEMRRGDGAFGPMLPNADMEVPVRPGVVTIRATGADGSFFEETIEVPDGGEHGIFIRLRR